MTDPRLELIRREVADLEARLGEPATTGARQELKRRITAVFQETEGALGELAALRGQIRDLVSCYQQVSTDSDPP